MQILIITDYLPYPAISGDTIRVYNLVKRMARENEVTLFALFGGANQAVGMAHLKEFCREVEVFDHQWPHPFSCFPDLLWYFIQGKPIELRLLYSPRMAKRIRQITADGGVDIVDIEHSRLALYREDVHSFVRKQVVLVFHNVAFDQYSRIYQIEKNFKDRFRSWLFAWQLKSWEPAYAENFARCLMVSEEDRQILLRANSRLKTEVIPNGTDTGKYHVLDTEKDSQHLLFIGSMGYAPCVDGAVWFCKEVLPLVWKKFPEVHFWIVGAKPAPEVLELAGERVHVTGFVDDVVPYYQKAAITVVPLRAGGGTRLKILEAMALGRVVLSTSIGCEGIGAVNGEHLFVEDEPVKMAARIMLLLADRELIARTVLNARKFVVEKYDWEQITQKLLNVFSSLLQKEKSVKG